MPTSFSWTGASQRDHLVHPADQEGADPAPGAPRLSTPGRGQGTPLRRPFVAPSSPRLAPSVPRVSPMTRPSHPTISPHPLLPAVVRHRVRRDPLPRRGASSRGPEPGAAPRGQLRDGWRRRGWQPWRGDGRSRGVPRLRRREWGWGLCGRTGAILPGGVSIAPAAGTHGDPRRRRGGAGKAVERLWPCVDVHVPDAHRFRQPTHPASHPKLLLLFRLFAAMLLPLGLSLTHRCGRATTSCRWTTGCPRG